MINWEEKKETNVDKLESMGGLLTRSSAVQGDVKMKKDKRKRRLQQLEVSFEPDIHLIPDENEDSNIDFIHTYESWESQRMMNANGKK